MRPAAVLLLLLAGCTPRLATLNQAAPGSFDAAAWLARARTVAVADVADTSSDDPRLDAVRPLAHELDAATGWQRACDTRWDPDTQQSLTEDGSPSYVRGLFTVHDIGPDEAVVAVACDFGAYQGTYALVHLVGSRAALLVGPQVDEAGAPYGPPAPVYATPAFDAGTRSFATLGLARGLGDCGLYASYELTGLGRAQLVEARARGCDGDPAAAPPPDRWPVVFPR